MAAIGPEQQRLTPFERENLVAYLDGELDEAATRALSTKLTSSPTARREIEVLERTWELLNYLPLPKASEDFAEKTFTEVRRIAERGDQIESRFFQLALRFSRAMVLVAASIVLAAAAYLVVLWAIPNPSERLANDLPIAEHLDEFRDVKDKAFLDELLNSTEFNSATKSDLP